MNEKQWIRFLSVAHLLEFIKSRFVHKKCQKIRTYSEIYFIYMFIFVFQEFEAAEEKQLMR